MISLESVTDWPALGRRWRALEAEAACGFFRSWTFLGCEAARRFDRPVLIAATAPDGADLALGLCNRRRFRLHLHETGNPAWDAIFTEHNGFLLRPGAEALLPEIIRAALRHRPALVLSGVDEATRDAASAAAWTRLHAERFAPLAALGSAPFAHGLSTGFRAELRRAERAAGGAVTVARAETVAEAERALAELVALHDRHWRARGASGAFATDTIRAFHTALVARGVPRGEVDLLRVTAGPRLLGLLYNFRDAERAYNYQGGFAYTDDPRDKPGLLCHLHAAEWYRAQGLAAYDLLAGDQPYKRRFAAGGETLAWLTAYRRVLPKMPPPRRRSPG